MHPKSLSISKKGKHSTSNTGHNCSSLLIHAHGIELLLYRRNHSFPLPYLSRQTYSRFQQTQNISPLGFLPLQHAPDTWYDQQPQGSSFEFFWRKQHATCIYLSKVDYSESQDPRPWKEKKQTKAHQIPSFWRTGFAGGLSKNPVNYSPMIIIDDIFSLLLRFHCKSSDAIC